MAQDGLEKEFLTELDALEKFRISYSAQFPDAPLSPDDPDVRRLIEAMAFFTARTRLAAMRSLDTSVERIFRQHFPFLLGPVPAMAMLEATPGDQFATVTELPKDTEVLLKKPAEERDERDQLFRFRTLGPLRLMRYSVKGVERIDMPDGTERILITIAAGASHLADLPEISLHVNHLDDLRSSTTLVYELSSRLAAGTLRVGALYGKSPVKTAPAQPCSVSFGPPGDDADLPDPFEQPLQRARLDMRFPRRALFMNVSGLRPGYGWEQITLCLDVSRKWPRQLHLTTSTFRLHTVPIINVRRDLANPVECDGTRDRYAVKHPDPLGKYALLWAIGAYKPSKQGFVPLLPALLGAKGDSYEVTTEGIGEDRRAWASLRIEGAFKKPQLVSIDAFWHQPGLRDVVASDLEVSLGDRYVEGVRWSLSGPLVSHAEGQIDGDRERQLQLVSMKTLRLLGQDAETALTDLRALIEACGAHRESHFAKVLAALERVAVSPVPSTRRAQSFKYVYELGFGRLDPSDAPNVGGFCRWLLSLLRTWSPEEVVELAAVVPNLDLKLHHV